MARCLLALGPDSTGEVLHHLLDGAGHGIDLAVYEMGPSFAAPLARTATRGVAVRVLLDAHAGANSAAAPILAAGGAQCRVLGGRPGGEAHWKLAVVDGVALAVGSGNLLRRDAPPAGQAGTREWWVVVRQAATLVAEARRAFAAAWDEAEPPGVSWARAAPAPAVPPVGVPSPHVEPVSVEVAQARLRLLLGGAEVGACLAARLTAVRRRALVTVPYVHTHVAVVAGLLDPLRAAAARGAEVRLLLGAVPDTADAAALAATRLPVRVMDPRRSTTGHAKGMVADDEVVVGSANWSGAGLGGNREAALLLDDARAADWYAAALARDWSTAAPLHPSSG